MLTSFAERAFSQLLYWFLVAFLTTTGLFIILGRKPDIVETLVVLVFSSLTSWLATKILFGVHDYKKRREK